jgi:hypothetical protein
MSCMHGWVLTEMQALLIGPISLDIWRLSSFPLRSMNGVVTTNAVRHTFQS